jgi:hypothetical protein
LNNIIINFYTIINDVQAGIVTSITKIADTFAPIPTESFGLKLALDLVSLGYALVAAPVWNSVLKGFSFFKANGNTLETLKDTINSLVSNGATIPRTPLVATRSSIMLMAFCTE